jgi:DNA-binding CsgD family transcriptional regulator
MHEQIFNLPRYLAMLSPTAKREAADELRRMAAQLDRQADNDARTIDAAARVKRHRNKRRDDVHRIARMLVNGLSLNAIGRRLPAYSPEQIAAMAARARPVMRQIEKAERDKTISRLAQKGLTNAEIGQRLNLHPVSVSRIIGQTWRGKKSATGSYGIKKAGAEAPASHPNTAP